MLCRCPLELDERQNITPFVTANMSIHFHIVSYSAGVLQNPPYEHKIFDETGSAVAYMGRKPTAMLGRAAEVESICRRKDGDGRLSGRI